MKSKRKKDTFNQCIKNIKGLKLNWFFSFLIYYLVSIYSSIFLGLI